MGVGVAGVVNYCNTSSGTASNVVAYGGVGGPYEYCSFFSVLNWFAKGEQGAWYDPSDITTLFQDSAGTTPVTAVEQPVGLMLDKSKGLALGAELNTGNGFSSWLVLGGTWTLSSTSAIGSSATGFIYRVGMQTSPNAYYEISGVVTGYSAGNFYISVTTGPQDSLLVAKDGAFTLRCYDYSSDPSNTTIYIKGNGFTGTITNISVKQIAGNHAFQATAGNRPTLSARVNLLTKTEDFSLSNWGWLASTVTPNTTTAPDGTNTAATLLANGSPATHGINATSQTSLVSTPTATLIIYVKADTNNFIQFASDNSASYINFDLINGVRSKNGSGIDGDITPVGNGWYKCTMVQSVNNYIYVVLIASYTSLRYESNSLSSSVYIWHPDLRPTNAGALLPPYQRVNTASDYDTAGFPLYLKANGTSSAMSTNSIDFTGTDKMTVVTGVRKLSDALQGTIVELSTLANAGSCGVITSQGVANSTTYCAVLTGTLTTYYSPAGYPSPTSNVVGLTADISQATKETELIPRINGVISQSGGAGANAGTGNFGNYPLYLLARAGTSNFLNGQFYGAIIRGAASDTASVTQTENYMATKTGITF